MPRAITQRAFLIAFRRVPLRGHMEVQSGTLQTATTAIDPHHANNVPHASSHRGFGWGVRTNPKKLAETTVRILSLT